MHSRWTPNVNLERIKKHYLTNTYEKGAAGAGVRAPRFPIKVFINILLENVFIGEKFW